MFTAAMWFSGISRGLFFPGVPPVTILSLVMVFEALSLCGPSPGPPPAGLCLIPHEGPQPSAAYRHERGEVG